MLRRNGYVLEQLLSPLVVHTTDAHAELAALAPAVLTSHHAHHYRGFASTQWRLFEKTGELKPLLYTFRVLLTGIHLMRSGQLRRPSAHALRRGGEAPAAAVPAGADRGQGASRARRRRRGPRARGGRRGAAARESWTRRRRAQCCRTPPALRRPARLRRTGAAPGARADARRIAEQEVLHPLPVRFGRERAARRPPPRPPLPGGPSGLDLRPGAPRRA